MKKLGIWRHEDIRNEKLFFLRVKETDGWFKYFAEQITFLPKNFLFPLPHRYVSFFLLKDIISFRL